MNAKESIKKVKELDKVSDVTAFLNAEKEGGNRLTVVDACEERIGELSVENFNPEDKSEDKSSEAPEEVEQMSEEEVRVMNFFKKIPFSCRLNNIVNFAEGFFAEDLKSAKVDREKSIVKITLKSGKKFDARGI